MTELKIATFNVEWMIALFGGENENWDGSIPSTLPPGKELFAGFELEAIEDVPALCHRIAGVIKDCQAQIIGIQEGPPRKEQMELFVELFLDNEYRVFSSNSRNQTIYALVHHSIAPQVTFVPHNSPEMEKVWSNILYQPWGTVSIKKRRTHEFYRKPLILQFQPAPKKQLDIIIVHAKSQFSKLQNAKQWEAREKIAVLSAIDARQKLAAEIDRLRQYIEQQIKPPNQDKALIIMGDLNEGPLADELEQEFLIHNVIDKLFGSALTPNTDLKHAACALATTNRFRLFYNINLSSEIHPSIRACALLRMISYLFRILSSLEKAYRRMHSAITELRLLDFYRPQCFERFLLSVG